MQHRAFATVMLTLTLSACSAAAPGSVPGNATATDGVRPSKPGASFTTLYSFQGPPDGADPESPLYLSYFCTDTCNETLYGTANAGGTDNAGTMYDVYAPGGSERASEKTLLSFAPSETGSAPTSAIFRDRHRSLFATASQGGAANKGTIVKLHGSSVVVFSFDGRNGASPTSGLTPDDSQTAYYATVFAGGAHNEGAVLLIRPLDKRFVPKVIHSFGGSGEGVHPNSALAYFLNNGPYFGTTAGSKKIPATVYSIGADQKFTTVFTFSNVADGVLPTGVNPTPLTHSKPVSLFGTTVAGGASGDGVLYQLEPSTTGSGYAEVVLHTFIGGKADGAYPQGPPVARNDGLVLYGLTEKGGSHNCGTIFQFDASSGAYSVVYSFKCGDGGAYPKAGLINCLEGVCGTTSAGGTAKHGTVFAFKPPKTE